MNETAQNPVPPPEDRPDWDEYFMGITHLISQRSTCMRRKVGAILVKDKRILSSGYNGAPAGLPHCSVTGCLRQEMGIPSGQRAEICRGLHAEQNAIIQSAYHGVSCAGATLYCTNRPCAICVKMLINAGIVEIVFDDWYPDQLADKLLAESAIRVRRYQGGKR